MKNRFRIALAAAGLALFSGGASAQIKEFKSRTPQVPPSLDKVQMVSFVSEPAQIAPGATQVVLRVTVKNVTDSGLATGYVLTGLKVKIFRTKPLPEILEMETTVNNLALGVPQSVGAPVNIGPGEREYTAKVDPDNTLKEPAPQQRANNEMRLRLTIPQVSGQQAPPAGSQPPQLATQVLDYEKAKQAGAQSSYSPEGFAACPIYGSFYDPNHAAVGPPPMPFTVRFYLDCGGVPAGMRATPETFGGFRLKHGWKVKSLELLQEQKRNGDWQWRERPAIGSDNPAMRMHLWANADGMVHVIARVTIEGPAGTDPYQ
jgi:hypothetical protein